MTPDYDEAALIQAYRDLGLREGDVVNHKSNLAVLGLPPKENLPREKFLEMHYRALRKVIGEDGTVMVASWSFELHGTDNAYNPATTPSPMGIFNEYIRLLPGALRSFHPFVSYSAIGPKADFLCRNLSRNGYGPNTPEQRLCEIGGKDVSLGVNYFEVCSMVHNAEFYMGVPYRYTKEYLHPVVRDGVLSIEAFYRHVWYYNLFNDCAGLPVEKRNRNARFFQEYRHRGHEVKSVAVGRSEVSTYLCAAFCSACMDVICRDPYAWMETPPDNRPYQR